MKESTKSKENRISAQDIRSRKGKTPLVCITAYSTPMSNLFDEYVDLILVGDSVGMVLYGLPSTLAVSVDMMINHGAAVVRGAKKACVVVDLPFGSYQSSPSEAFHVAQRVMAETSCDAIKLEGGRVMAKTVEFLVNRGIPVMGHIGMLPQSFKQTGGYKVQGRALDAADEIVKDAIALEESGAFSIVIESVLEPLAIKITDTVSVPTIGIGASVSCDGQIIVAEDILGMFTDFQPKFVKKYSNLAPVISKAIKEYAEDVRGRKFPNAENCYYDK
jgi:3-methyl-2-oxobutanoate hydroxymethyltransferase